MATIKAKPFNVNQIKIISQSLLHSYEYKDGFPILKELVQNADDAESTELRIHFYEGIPEASHPLLRRKGIFVYDNGKFSSINDVDDEKKSNEYGVLSIGGTDKDDDIEKIGKYGLGMKSIFHICDAFFYYINKENRLGAINPFANSDGIDSTHPDWSELGDKDQDLLIKEIKKIIPENNGFTILIPDGMPEINQIIANNGKRDIDIEYPFNKDDIENKNLIENLSIVLALLPKVSTHRDNFKRIVFNNKKIFLVSSSESTKNSIVTTINNKEVSRTNYCYFETSDFICFEGEQIRKYLKENNAISSDKITSNHSVFYELLKTPKKNNLAKLTIKYCVYLPLQKPENLEININSDFDFTILINGSFLIDEGRKGIESFEYLTKSKLSVDTITDINIRNSGIVTDTWNKLIAQYIVFPYLPFLFEKANSEKLITLQECEELLAALKSLSVSCPNLINEYTTAYKSFVEVYDFSSSKIYWKIINSKEDKCIYLPENCSFDILKELFPAIHKYKDVNLLNGDGKNTYLIPERIVFAENVIYELLTEHTLVSSIKRTHINALAAFIKLNKNVIAENIYIQKVLIKKIKELFLKNENLSSERTAFINLFNTINDCTANTNHKIFAVDKSGVISKDEWKQLWNMDSDFILIPGIFELNNECSEENLLFGDTSICSVLNKIELKPETQFIILNSLDAIQKYFAKISEIFPNLCIYELHDVYTQKSRYIETTSFRRILNEKLIFSGIPVGNNPLITLARLLQNENVYSIQKDNIKKYNINETLLLENNKENIINFLYKKWQNNKYLIIDENYKDRFVDEIFHTNGNIEINSNNRNFYRYIFSGFKNIDSNIPIFYINAKFTWKLIFNNCDSEGEIIPFTGIDSLLIENKEKEKLNVKFVDDQYCFDELRRYSNYSSLDFILEYPELNTETFKNDIYGKINPDDKSLFFKLPYQIDSLTKETIHHIDENCYLNDENIHLPKNCPIDNLRLIEYSKNSKERHLQELFFKEKQFTKNRAIRIVISNSKDKSLLEDWIFNLIKDAKIAEIDSLWNIPWISTGNGNYTSFDKILNPNIIPENTINIISKNTEYIKIEDLKISSEHKEIIRSKKLYIKKIEDFLESLLFQIEKLPNSLYITIETIEDLKILAEIYKSDFSIYEIFHSLLNDLTIKDKEEKIVELYKKINVINVTYETRLKALNKITAISYQKKFIKFYNELLSKICNDNRLDLSEILYPNLNGEWKTADELSADSNESIDPAFILRADTQSILSERLNKVQPKESDEFIDEETILTSDSSINEIKAFFRSWENAAEHKELVAFFLYLLRDNFRKAIEDDYSSYSFEKIQKSEEFKYTERAHEIFWSSGYTQQEAFGDSKNKYFKVIIHVPDTQDYLTVHAISGKRIRVKIDQQNDNPSVMIGEPKYSNYLIEMSLLPKASIDKKDDIFIRRAIERIFKQCYRQWLDNEISRFLSNLINESQNTIKEAEESILEDVFTVLRTYGVRNKTFIKYSNERAECKRKHSNKSYSRNQAENDKLYYAEKNRISSLLMEAVKKDEELKNDIFNSVKRKIIQSQYDQSSVLFEFFQNADDSVNDLFNCNKEIDEKNKSFIVHVSEPEIIISHYGRMINDTLNNTEYKDKFSQDLYNMLSLYASVKTDENGDTGKFGLGFKSVYTICDKPIIHSGNLDFEIVAGVYPSNIDRISIDRGETRFVLKGDYSSELEHICSRFIQNIFYLALFSKQIKNIQIDGFYNESASITKNIIYNDDVRIVSEVSNNKHDYVLFENNELKYKLLFRIKDNRIISLSDTEIPKVWNITPLNSVSRLPFIINAEFVVDQGRLTLADEKFNNELLSNISKDLSLLIIKARENLSKTLSDDIIADFLEIFVNTKNLQDSTFRNFAHNICKEIFENNGILPNGIGGLIKNDENFTIYSIDLNKYSNKGNNAFIESVETYLRHINPQSSVITQIIADAYKDLLDTKPISLNELLNLVPEQKIDNYSLSLFSIICDYIQDSFNIWSELSLEELKLLNKNNEWKNATSFILEDIDNAELELNDEYSDDVIKLLSSNSLFETYRANFNSQLASEKDNKIAELENKIEELKNLAHSNEPDSISNIIFDDYDPIADEFNSYIPTKTIQQLYDEWHAKSDEDRKSAAERYYSNLLPTSVDFDRFVSSEEELSDSDWFIIFLLAVYQSRPFCRDLNNKNFLNQLDALDKTGHLLEKLGSHKPSKYPQVWIDVILDFLDGKTYDQEYFSWFNEFPKMVEMAEFKDVYMQVLHDLNKLPEKDKHSILTPETLNEYSGSSIRKAPTIDRTVRIGFSLIIRELIRKGELLPDPKIEKFAFMPKSKCIKFILGSVGNPHATESEDLYRQIVREIGPEKARFDGYYDIPLLLEVRPGERS